MKKLVHVIAAAACATSFSATAASAQGMGDSDVNPWQECGIGAMVFPENGVASAISNVIWDLGTTAVTSAISSPDQCKGASVQVAAFVSLGYDHISRETVVGDGEFLQTLMNGINCDPSVQNAVVADMRDEYSAQLQDTSFADKDHDSKAEAYFLGLRDVVRTNYSDSCEAF